MWPKIFNRQSAPVSEAEKFLIERRYGFEKQLDGSLLLDSWDFSLSGKGLTKLPNLTNVVVRNHFNCGDNELTSLEGAPTVGGMFFCHNNKLTTLKGAPPSVGGEFYCYKNPLLKSLEGAPTQFLELVSDLGTFSSWDQVPEKLRLSPETRERMAREKIEAERQAIAQHVVLQKKLLIRRPLKLHRQ
jgi:hypothetical protein